jgi:uncharacterized damage-inducible protein DinB
MTKIEEQVVETWRIHNRTYLFLIENISDKALKATLSKRGGRDVAAQLAHVHNVRVWRLESFAKKSGMKLSQFEKGASPSKIELLKAFKVSGQVMEKFIEHCLKSGGDVSNFKRGVVPMVGYYISHEAHHRGHAFLTMKATGFPLTDNLRWYIWDWNKI